MAETEAQLEDRLIKRLEKLGYEYVDFKDKDSLLNNLKSILNERNKEKLDGEPLTEAEFNRFFRQLTGGSIYEVARTLRDQTITIERDDVNKPALYLDYFDADNYENNVYQVANQITIQGLHENRYDVTILVNGLPLIQIELKKKGIELNQAFNQIMRYRQVSYMQSELFKLVQMFVVSNENDTRYFATGSGELNPNFMFVWTDEDNKWINDIFAFSDALLNPKRAHSMIAKYTIFDEKNKAIMLMRPYQVYATQRIVEQATQTDKNGYVWHTTGAGKTLTAFKTSQLLAKNKAIAKVIFLLDRKDLDKQTTDNFKSYAESNDLLNGTDSTYDLVRQLKSNDTNLVITTIQKMNNAVTRHVDGLQKLKDKKVVFIVDEAHRSQFGKQQMEISRFFSRAQWFGFTGTPRFKDNPAQDGRTTDDIFTDLLHSYLINDAIRDGNVLGFQIDYMKTMRLEDGSYVEDDEQVAAIDTEELFTSENRIQRVVEDIITHHEIKTRFGKYSAFFTVPNTKMAVRYYDALKAEVAKRNKDLRIATVFSWQANEEGNENADESSHSQLQMDRIIKEYNETFGTNFDTDNFAGYANDISTRVKKNIKGSNIDILVVVNMMLTGFDAKTLNTLYVDKHMDYHNLMQSYSRTNRVETKTKPFGQIVAYRNLKQETDQALKLFGNTDNVGLMLQDPYDKVAAELQLKVKDLLDFVAEPALVDGLYGEEAQVKFIDKFRAVNRVLTRIEGYNAFSWVDGKNKFGITEDTYQGFRSKYLDLYQYLQDHPNKTTVLNMVDFEVELVERDTVNVDYIMNLIRQIPIDEPEELERQVKQIEDAMENSGDVDLRSKMELLKNFLDKVVPNLDKDADVDAELHKFANSEREKAMQSYSVKNDMDLQSIKDTFHEYQFTGNDTQEFLKKTTSGNFKTKHNKIKEALSFVMEVAKKYTIGA